MKPELLAPAGDFERLQIAINYGADAIYIGGDILSLRSKAKNFSLEDIEKSVQYAHNYNKKVYVATNIYTFENDFTEIENYFKQLEKIGVDAVIISDLGIFSIAKGVLKNTQIHISTQTNVTNNKAVEMYKNLGASRVVLARELQYSQITEIINMLTDFELEIFVHGAMCMAYSGRCFLSSHMTGRNANLGECAQPCRYEYKLIEKTRPEEVYTFEQDEKGSYFFNSKDLCLVEKIPQIIDLGVASLKIEGRMKSSYYVATAVKAYRNAIDDYLADKDLFAKNLPTYIDELKKASHRSFTTGFFDGDKKGDGQVLDTSAYVRNCDFVAVVLDYDDESGVATIMQRNAFATGDEVEIFSPTAENYTMTVPLMYDLYDVEFSKATLVQQIIKIKMPVKVSKFDILRKYIN